MFKWYKNNLLNTIAMIRVPLRSAIQQTIAILAIAVISIVIGYVSVHSNTSLDKYQETTLAMAEK